MADAASQTELCATPIRAAEVKRWVNLLNRFDQKECSIFHDGLKRIVEDKADMVSVMECVSDRIRAYRASNKLG